MSKAIKNSVITIELQCLFHLTEIPNVMKYEAAKIVPPMDANELLCGEDTFHYLLEADIIERETDILFDYHFESSLAVPIQYM